MKHGRSDVARGKRRGGTALDAFVVGAAVADAASWAPPLLRSGQYLHAFTDNRGGYVDPAPGTKRHAALQLPGGLKDAKR